MIKPGLRTRTREVSIIPNIPSACPPARIYRGLHNLQAVCTALDNVEARLYMDQR